MKRILIIFALGALFFGCDQFSPPEINDMEWRLLYRDNGERRFEEISIFLLMSDPDGNKDLSLVTLTAGDTGLIWEFPREEWILVPVSESEEWWGMPSAVPLGSDRFPDVLYTIRLDDVTGESDTQTFRLSVNRKFPDPSEWPRVKLENGILRMNGPYKTMDVILRNKDYNALQAITLNDGDSLNTVGSYWWETWIGLRQTSGGFRLGPFRISSLETE